MTSLTFPTLNGQGWSVHKTPKFSTLIAPHVSGREVRDALYLNPIWEFEAVFDGLDSSASSYPGLGAQSLQSLMGLFLQCQGQWGTFLYNDPTDYAVSGQQIGVGNGSTTTFQLARNLGGFSDAVLAPFAATAPTLFALPGSSLYAPNNILYQSVNLASPVWQAIGATVGAGVANPTGGANAFTLTATAAAASLGQTGNPLGGANAVNSVWLRRRAGAGAVSLAAPNGAPVTVAPSALWQRFVAASAPWSASGANFAITLANAGDQIDVYGPQTEISTLATPGPFSPTLTTLAFGSPSITVGGAYVDPASYALANGLVTFAAAPAVGAAIGWTGYFGFLCRFDDDKLDFEQFMQNLWKADSVKFRSVRAL